MSCPYKYVLGIPGQGFHAARLMGYSLNDTVGTFILALLTSWIFGVPIVKSLIVWYVGGEILHYLFGVQTAFLTTIGVVACPKTDYSKD